MNISAFSAFILTLLVSFSTVAKDESPIVLTSIQPLAFLAQEVVGEHGQVKALLSPYASPHHYSLKPSDRSLLAKADLVLWVGNDLETMLIKPLQQRSAPVLTASELDGMTWPEAAHEDEHDHHSGRDPHIWLSAHNNQIMIDALVVHLAKIAPQHQQAYQENGRRLQQALKDLDKRLEQKMAALADSPFIVAHPAYNHFVERYGLKQLDYIALTPERKAGAKHLYQLRQMQGAKCVFQDEGVNNPTVDKLSKDIGAKMSHLDLMGINKRSIVELIEGIGSQLEHCLAGAV